MQEEICDKTQPCLTTPFLAAAIHSYSEARSLRKSSPIAGLDRTDFLLALAREGEDAVVVDFAELEEKSNVAESALVLRPFIFSHAGLLDLPLLISVIVPESVATEIEISGKRDPTAQAVANTSRLVVTQKRPAMKPSHLRRVKSMGELLVKNFK